MDASAPTPLPERPSVLDAFLFSARAAVAAVAAYLVYERFLTIPGAIWAAVSALLVSQPALHPSLRASLARCVANLIGAGFGSLAVAALGPTLPALALGVVATGMTCHVARLDDSLRPAYVAVAIVVLTLNPSLSVWAASLDRLLAVAVGCGVSIAVTFAFAVFLGGLKRHVLVRQGETE